MLKTLNYSALIVCLSSFYAAADLPAINGNYTTKIETEIEYDQNDEAVWSKVKYVIGEGNIRPKSWDNWFIGYHFSRENFYAGKPYSHQIKDGEVGNSIMEFQPHYVQNTDWGHYGINIGAVHESIQGGLFKPRIRPFGSYKITDNLEVFTSWMFFREMFYQEGKSDKNILETDSSITYHFDNGHVALGYLAKFGENVDDDNSRKYPDGSRHEKFGDFSELIWKPRVHYRFNNKLGVTLFSEIGRFKDETDHAEIGQRFDIYEEDFQKYGVFIDYPLSESLNIFTEMNYRTGEITEKFTAQNAYSKRDRTHNFAMIGLNVKF